MTNGEPFTVEPAADGLVRIRTDMPGIRATSALVDPVLAIQEIAVAANLTVADVLEALAPAADPDSPAEAEETAPAAEA